MGKSRLERLNAVEDANANGCDGDQTIERCHHSNSPRRSFRGALDQSNLFTSTYNFKLHVDYNYLILSSSSPCSGAVFFLVANLNTVM